jgi:hypothetical protein
MSHLTEQQLLLLQQQCQQASASPYTASSQCSSHKPASSISGVSYIKVDSRPRSSSCSGRATYPPPPYPLYPDCHAGRVTSSHIGTISQTSGPYYAPSTSQNTTFRDLSAPGCVTSGSGPAHFAASRAASEAGLGHSYCYQQQSQQQQQSVGLIARRRTDTDVLAGEHGSAAVTMIRCRNALEHEAMSE